MWQIKPANKTVNGQNIMTSTVDYDKKHLKVNVNDRMDPVVFQLIAENLLLLNAHGASKNTRGCLPFVKMD